jgi:broad specificity phosphatase PhoE
MQTVYLARHGETAWTLSGQHTSVTDLPLTDRGKAQARTIGERLKGRQFAAVFTSPLQRARVTCDLAGYGGAAKPDADLIEWNYGAYEGRRTVEILEERPGWNIFRDGCPGGESVAAVGARADRVLAKLRQIDGDILIFSSAHFLRVLTARWLGLEPAAGRLFLMDTGTICVLTYEHHNVDEPVIKF